MASCPEAMCWKFWDFWKKQLVEIWTWGKAVQLAAKGCAVRLLGQLIEILALGRAVQLGVDWRVMLETVRIAKIVSLSPRVEKLKVKES